MEISIRIMTLDDYEPAYQVWSSAEGICLGEEDGRDGIALYLQRNPASCFVALDGEEIIGVVLCGHEGRRGILRHLAVKPEYRKCGVGRALVGACLKALSDEGIKACNIFVMDDNRTGMQFWEHLGFHRLEDNYRTLQHRT